MRESKDNVFLAIAYIVSKLSHDGQTQHGCVIIDKEKRIKSLGFNGFPRRANDKSLISRGYHLRPKKYPLCIHSEENAVLNYKGDLEGCAAYVTGKCCHRCLRTLWQAGIKQVICLDRISNMCEDKQEQEAYDLVKEETGISVLMVKPDLSFLLNVIHELFTLGFIHTEREKVDSQLQEFAL